MAFICGSFRSQEEDSYDLLSPFSSTRKPSKRKPVFGSRRNKTATNPYSDRGLDKFEALLAELDQKRQEILTQKGSEDISMVKFIYTSPNEVKPIVIKIQSQTKQDNTSSLSTSSLDHQKEVAFVKDRNEDDEPVEEKRKKPLVDHEGIDHQTIRFEQFKRKIGELWKPWYYLPLFVMLILVLLMFSGRSFAILFTSIGWYMVPIVNERLHNSKPPNNIVTKKDYLKKSRRSTDKQ